MVSADNRECRLLLGAPDLTGIPFWKWESIANDFPLFHADDLASVADIPRFVVGVSDRRYGIGGDGVLVLGKEETDLRLRMFNPDGTEDFCGNGLRVAAAHAQKEGWVGDQFTIRHLNRNVQVSIAGDDISTVLGVASYDGEKVPHRAWGELFNANVWAGMDGGHPLSLYGSALTTGSTHVVIPIYALPDDASFKSVSAQIEVDPKFPERTSVIWSQELQENELRIRIWERGVGETQGCGTGSSAASVDYLRRKGRGGKVLVHNPGGDVTVSMDSWDSPITITGKSHFVFQGAWPV